MLRIFGFHVLVSLKIFYWEKKRREICRKTGCNIYFTDNTKKSLFEQNLLSSAPVAFLQYSKNQILLVPLYLLPASPFHRPSLHSPLVPPPFVRSVSILFFISSNYFFAHPFLSPPCRSLFSFSCATRCFLSSRRNSRSFYLLASENKRKIPHVTRLWRVR